MTNMFDDLLGSDLPERPVGALPGDSVSLPYEIHERALAGLLRCSTASIRSKVADQIFIRTKPGHYDLSESVGRYVVQLREQAARAGRPSASSDSVELKAERLRLTRAQADAQEQKNRLAAGEMVAIADVRAEWVTVAIDLRSQILAIAPRIAARAGLTRDAAVLLEEEIRAALEGLDDER